MRITVFGSASAADDGPLYRHARELGRLLAAAGHTVCTGGYDGTMAAVSRGAHEHGGHVVGVTMAPWARFSLRANPWVREEIATSGLLARLGRLLESDGFVALHGGIGTLTEVTLAWQLLQAWELPPAPLVLVGEAWRTIVEVLAQALVMRPGDLDLLTLVDSPQAALAALQRFDMSEAQARRAQVRAELLAAHGGRG